MTATAAAPDFNEYYIFCLTGKRGAGKTGTMAALAEGYSSCGFNIFSNFTLYNVSFKYVDFDKLADFPEWLHDGVIFMDEAHVGVDSYDTFLSRVKNITDFVTQLRKRRLILIYSTQVFLTVAKRLRMQTDYILECHKAGDGYALIRVFDRGVIANMGYSGDILVYLKPFYNSYDTNQIISVGD